MLAALLAAHGVREAVMSPGSRNAPLMVALERNAEIHTRIVVDERSAAFIGLGMAEALQKPVALVCTSGTAPLNYAPALAEAFYRHIPLIAITADRPEEWIDQDDSQTIVQPGIFANFIKGTFDIPVESDEPSRMWMVNRKLNDALILASTEPKGPVHINIRLDEPLGEIVEVDDSAPRKIEAVNAVRSLDKPFGIGPDDKVMIICGFMSADDYCNGFSNDENDSLWVSLNNVARHHNVVVMHEAQSNLHNFSSFLPNIDATLSRLDTEYAAPDVVITLGGSLTSRKIKAFLRNIPALRHISVGLHNHSVDCLTHLSERIFCTEAEGMRKLAEELHYEEKPMSLFKTFWQSASWQAKKDAEKFAAEAPWCDFKATSYVISNMPPGWHLQLSNGTSVRYAQLFNYSRAATIHCNRGVSGIDGCTSTAIGSALVYDKPTILLTGDTSMQYDIGALATTFIPPTFKIIVLNNGGGGIFRFIPSTKHLDELEKCFVADLRLPLEKLSEAYGFAYFSAKNIDELKKSYSAFLKNNSVPSILEIITDGELSASVLTQFLQNKK